MNIFEKVINFLDKSAAVPSLYGWYHILCIFIVFTTTIVCCIKLKNCKQTTFNKIVLISWIILVVFEIYKQVVYSFSFNGEQAVWAYHKTIFPLQLCSSILYVLPFAVFLKDSKLKDCFVAFIISFSLFGGLAVMFYTGDVFDTTVGINIQTMVHHGIQVFMGFMFIVHYRHKLNVKFFLKAIPVFVVYAITAMAVNQIWAGQINMMYLSPYVNSGLPIVKDIYLAVPYVVYLLLMLAAYVLASFIVYVLMLKLVKNIHTGGKKANCNIQKE